MYSWGVCFSLTGGRPYKTKYPFLFFNFLCWFYLELCYFFMTGLTAVEICIRSIFFHSKKIYHFQKLRVTNYCGSLMEWSLNLSNVHVCLYFLVISIYNSSNNTSLFKVSRSWERLFSSHCYVNTGTCFSIPYVSIMLILVVK